MKIGSVTIDGKLTLGPMAGVTDAAFREVCREQGAALTATEMVSAKALVYGDRKTKDLLYIHESDHPIAAQIFGHEPDVMAEAAKIALDISGADFIDINMGCPVGKVVKSGDGSALMSSNLSRCHFVQLRTPISVRCVGTENLLPISPTANLFRNTVP